MKICFFNSAKVWGGGEKWHLDHALAFQQGGHEVFVVSDNNSELLQRAAANNIKTKAFAIGNLSFLNPFKLIALYSFFRKERFDVLVMNFSKDLKVAAPMAKLAGIKKIVYRRGSALPIKNTVLNRFLYGKCVTDILANSQATKESILHYNKHLFPEEKIKIIYNGITIPETAAPHKENPIPVIGNLGRLVYQKGMDILLDIAFILKQRGIKCRFIIGGDGTLMDELQQKANELDLSGFVQFIGFVHNAAEFMADIDIFALTSRGEGFGYVTAEAMVSKLPVVAFNVGSNPELITDKETGYLIPAGNNEMFADKLQYLIEHTGTRNYMGKNGYKTVIEKFNFEKNIQQVIEFLSEGN